MKLTQTRTRKRRKAKGKWHKKKLSNQLSKRQSDKAEESFQKSPHSIVFHRGKVGRLVRQLVKDLRLVMEPFTASKLQMRKKNVLKDFVSVSSMLNISHLLSVSRTDTSVNLHIAKLPRGPTLTFRIVNYSLVQDVLAYIKKPTLYQASYTTSPLLVMNNFSGTELPKKLVTSMFQNMFPSINVNSVKLTTIRRCVLLSYNTEDDTIDFRHYIIRIMPSGMSRAVRKLIKPKLPDLGRYNDISDYIDQGGNLSESEAENDGDHNQVYLPQNMPTKGNIRGSKSAIRLLEVGPRMTLKLHKIEEGLWTGNILYNSQVSKSPEEIALADERRAQKVETKKKLTSIQKQNIKKKEEAKRLHKEQSLIGIRKKFGLSLDSTVQPEKPTEDAGMHDDDDDRQYYINEVGELPDKDLHLQKPRKRKLPIQNDDTEAHKRIKNKPPPQQRISGMASQRLKKSLKTRTFPAKRQMKKSNKFSRNFAHTLNASKQSQQKKAKNKKRKSQ